MRNSVLKMSIVVAASIVAFGASAQQNDTTRTPEAASQTIVNSQRVQNDQAPGSTKEVAPDSKQTATGGQPGGVPGYH